MTTSHAGEWVPLIDRGDGAWIGVMPTGEIGAGVLQEGRASLVASGYIPMWAFMEGELSACLGELRRVWDDLAGRGISSPENLVELTVRSAWNSGGPYWMQLAAGWMPEMSRTDGFDRQFIQEALDEMVTSESLSDEVLDHLRISKRAVSS